MPWTHENGTIICESAKHNRRVEFLLRSPAANHKCYSCWRKCEFRRIGGVVEHVFRAEKSMIPADNAYFGNN